MYIRDYGKNTKLSQNIYSKINATENLL